MMMDESNADIRAGRFPTRTVRQYLKSFKRWNIFRIFIHREPRGRPFRRHRWFHAGNSLLYYRVAGSTGSYPRLVACTNPLAERPAV
jgi:hypothetical protein